MDATSHSPSASVPPFPFLPALRWPLLAQSMCNTGESSISDKVHLRAAGPCVGPALTLVARRSCCCCDAPPCLRLARPSAPDATLRATSVAMAPIINCAVRGCRGCLSSHHCLQVCAPESTVVGYMGGTGEYPNYQNCEHTPFVDTEACHDSAHAAHGHRAARNSELGYRGTGVGCHIGARALALTSHPPPACLWSGPPMLGVTLGRHHGEQLLRDAPPPV